MLLYCSFLFVYKHPVYFGSLMDLVPVWFVVNYLYRVTQNLRTNVRSLWCRAVRIQYIDVRGQVLPAVP